jgi:hypothetical protein
MAQDVGFVKALYKQILVEINRRAIEANKTGPDDDVEDIADDVLTDVVSAAISVYMRTGGTSIADFISTCSCKFADAVVIDLPLDSAAPNPEAN